MPTVYETILARVKQKVATEEEWLLVEDELGPIFEGEQAFVVDASGNGVNFKIGDGTKKFSELPYFIAYYDFVQSLKRLSFLSGNTDIVVPGVFKAYSQLHSIIVINNSSSDILLNVGTSSSGSEIAQITVPIGSTTISCKYLFDFSQNLYLSGLDGKPYSIFILYLQLDESPAVPPAAAANRLYNKGTAGMFLPLYAGHFEEVWDSATGRGKSGSGYDNCILTDFVDSPVNMAGKSVVGVGTGQDAGVRVGAANNNLTIAMANLPNEGVGLFRSQVSSAGGSSAIPGENDNITRSRGVSSGTDFSQQLNYEMVKATGTSSWVGKSKPMGNGTALSVANDSITFYFFVAVE